MEGFGQKGWRRRWKPHGVSRRGCLPLGFAQSRSQRTQPLLQGQLGKTTSSSKTKISTLPSSRLAEQRALQSLAQLGKNCQVQAFFYTQFCQLSPFRQQATRAGDAGLQPEPLVPGSHLDKSCGMSARLQTWNPTLSPAFSDKQVFHKCPKLLQFA